MTSKTTNKFSPEVRTRAVRMVLDHEGEHASRWAAVVSISAKIGCTPQTLHDWVKKAETDSGKRSGVPSDVSDRLKAPTGPRPGRSRRRYCQHRGTCSSRFANRLRSCHRTRPQGPPRPSTARRYRTRH